MNDRSATDLVRVSLPMLIKLMIAPLLAVTVSMPVAAQEGGFDVSSQIGPDPLLPEPRVS